MYGSNPFEGSLSWHGPTTIRSMPDPHIYGGPGQTHRDAPLSPRGEVIWRVIVGALLLLAVGIVVWAQLS